MSKKTCHYSRGVSHGGNYTGRFTFYVTGEADEIEFISWSAEYESFFETYKVWFIVMLSLAGIAAVIFIIVMIVQDLDLDDTYGAIIDFIADNAWIAALFVIPIAGTIVGIVTSYWVPVLIVLGGIVAFVLITLLAHLIKYIVENVSFGWGPVLAYDGYEYDDGCFDASCEDVEDYVDDEGKLALFSVEQLKDYCRENGIKGYSSLNKARLIELIVGTSKNGNDKTTTSVPQSKKQKSANKITFADIAGLEEAKSAFREKVIYAFEHKELYEKYGKKVGGRLLLYGLPGTGKTMFAEAASNEIDSLFIPIKCSDIKSKWYGGSEENVKKIFEKARKAKKAIIFFDEFEAIGAKRTDSSENLNNDLVPQILAEMQGVGASSESAVIVVIAATNKPWMIDSAFLRPGRFDEKIYIPLPDFEAREKMFELKLKNVPQDGLDYGYLAKVTDGFNGADIGAFCDKLKMLAINKSIAENKECPVTMDEVEQVHTTIKSSVSTEDVDRLLEFEEQFR
ncbi:MAG: AAA family ATPase [Clostridiales bacterium]|nr:AAA family ATPase [Clostridiales bacterium]